MDQHPWSKHQAIYPFLKADLLNVYCRDVNNHTYKYLYIYYSEIHKIFWL